VSSAADILARLDSAIRELLELRAEVAASMPGANGAGSEGADNPAPRGWRPRDKPSGRPVASAFTASTGSRDSEQFRSDPRTCWLACGRLSVW
jgi:hypothetical protein